MLISEGYRILQRNLHDSDFNYGQASGLLFPLIREVISQVQPRSILDYGAGKGRLKTLLDGANLSKIPYASYDPAFPEYGESISADMVCCIDVLEHIEPECLDEVLKDLHRVTQRIGMFTIHTGAAKKHLEDGRNAHLIQKPSSWWLPKLCKHFEIDYLGQSVGGFYILVCPQKC